MTDYKPKLIEVALPLAEISEASGRDKAVKQGHPSNLHQWWARRPLPAARAVLWASLVDDPSGHPDKFPTEEDQRRERERLFGILRSLIPWSASDDETVIAAARAEIVKSLDGDLPVVLDPFGGGGAIPLEAQRLGLEGRSGDLNPVAVTIQRAVVEIPTRFPNSAPVYPSRDSAIDSWPGLRGLAEDVVAYGEDLLGVVQEQFGHLYPRVDDPQLGELQPMTWIWARTVESPDPSWRGHVPLVKSWILSKKKNRPVTWACPTVDRESLTITYEIKVGGTPNPGTVRKASGTCVATGTAISNDYIKAKGFAGEMGHQLVAVVAEGPRRRVFLPPDEGSVAAARCPLPESFPTALMSTHSQYMGPPLYGFSEWHELFTPRQLTTLTALSDGLPALWSRVESDARHAGRAGDGIRFRDGGNGSAAYADAVVTYLAFAIDKLADLNNTLAAWEPEAQCPRHLFGGHRIPMVWDFAEANPFCDSSGSFRVVLDGIRKALVGKGFALTCLGTSGEVRQRDASARVAEVGRCVVSTDPPYYAQVPYADISDFFYVWMRRNLSEIWPDEFATLTTPKAEELVADTMRHGSSSQAAKFFEQGIFEVFSNIAEVHDPRIPATVFYAFRQVENDGGDQVSTGWETFLQGLLDAGLSITATWPVRTENKSRLRAMSSNALASSIVLACRKRSTSAPLETRGGFMARLRADLPEAVRLLQEGNIAPVDLAQSAIGPGMRIFSQYARVVESDGSTMDVRTALILINEVLGEVLSSEESELDPDSRFALTWFEQFGHKPGPFGDADVLARAKDTSVDGVVESGVAVSRGGQLRLLERDELGDDWSPVTDDRATVWEATQHLVRLLAESESRAAGLLRELGGVADRARQLAYLLFGVCEKNGWTDEAVAYNTLIVAWPEISQLAGSADGGLGQGTML